MCILYTVAHVGLCIGYDTLHSNTLPFPFSSLAASTCQWSESTDVQFSSAPGATGEKFTFSVLQLQQPVVVNLSGTLTRVTEMYTFH